MPGREQPAHSRPDAASPAAGASEDGLARRIATALAVLAPGRARATPKAASDEGTLP
jgi:hypothetical protein